MRVPDQALRYVPEGVGVTDEVQDGPRSHVFILRNGKPQQVEIRTGLDDDTFTEVTGGPLSEGDPVILSQKSGAGSRGRNNNQGSSPSMRFP